MDEQEEKQPIQYASPTKRLWAWVGIAYALLILGLNTYALSTGRYLTGLGSLGIAPALAGLGGTVILRHRSGQSRGGLAVCVLLSSLCSFLCALNLIHGLPLLLAQL